jgi:hypothetical protein
MAAYGEGAGTSKPQRLVVLPPFRAIVAILATQGGINMAGGSGHNYALGQPW